MVTGWLLQVALEVALVASIQQEDGTEVQRRELATNRAIRLVTTEVVMTGTITRQMVIVMTAIVDQAMVRCADC